MEQRYPTPEHRRIAEGLARILAADPRVWAVVLAGSLGWGGGAPDSDVDLAAFVDRKDLPAVRAEDWEARFRALGGVTDPVLGLHFGGIRADVDFETGEFAPRPCMPREDPYELAVGNYAAYSIPLFDRGGRFAAWRSRHLPYFEETWRRERMRLVWGDLHHNLDCVRRMAGRGLFFHGFERLGHAARYVVHYAFLQERKHAIDWFKHLEWQAVHVLGMPSLPADLAAVLALPELSAAALERHAARLEGVVARYLRPPS